MATIAETEVNEKQDLARDLERQKTGEVPVDLDEVVERKQDKKNTTVSNYSFTSQRPVKPRYIGIVLAVAFYLMVFLVTYPKGWKVTSTDPFGETANNNGPHPAFPGGVYFGILLILICGNALGILVNKTTGLPGLLGMLVAGMLLKNIPGAVSTTYNPLLDGIDPNLNSTLRNMALGIIMIRAGLGLDLIALKQQCAQMSFLSFVPCLGEAVCGMLISLAVFDEWNAIWGLQLGFILADVSPAVTTPLLLYFNDKGYGKSKGIPTILMAAGSINSVVAIVLYSVAKEFAWGDSSADASKFAYIIGYKLILQIFGVGLAFGWMVGFCASYAWEFLVNKEERFTLLFSICMMLLFGWKKVGLGGGGTLAALFFGASLQYYIQKNDLEPTEETEALMNMMWQRLGSVLLFTLLGASLDFQKLEGSVIGLGAVVIIVALAGRAVITLLSVLPIKNWTMNEKLFAVITWCPKATVQAALAGDALDTLNGYDTNDPVVAGSNYNMYEGRGMKILTTAILSIILTAPTFAVAMDKGGRKLLVRE